MPLDTSPRALDNFDRILRRLLSGAAIVLLGAMVVICFVEVVLRDMAGRSFGWYDELVGYLLVWLSYVGAVLAQQSQGHIGAEALVKRLPPAASRIVRAAVHAMLLVLQVFITWFGFELAARNMGDMAITVRVPMGVLYSVLPLSAAAMTAVHATQLVLTIRDDAPELTRT